jgi:hypothetical protein
MISSFEFMNVLGAAFLNLSANQALDMFTGGSDSQLLLIISGSQMLIPCAVALLKC